MTEGPESGHSRKENENIQDALDEESFGDVLDRKKDEAERENDQHVDLFETGNIWTQVGNTQAQRKAWQNGGISDEEPFEPVDIDGRLEEANGEEGQTSKDSEFYFDLSQEFPEDLDGANQSAQPSQSLWKDGKTAPLLNQYGEERRLWYMAQAGIYDRSDSVHDNNARQTESDPIANETRETSSSPPIVVYQTPARPTTQYPRISGTSSSSTPAHTYLPTPIQPVTNGVTPQRRGPAFSLAGNLNTPNGSGGGGGGACSKQRTPIQTPKRKTWQSTMASREEAKAAAAAAAAEMKAKSSSAKKKRKSTSSETPKSAAKAGRGGSSSRNQTPNRTAGTAAVPPGSAQR
ncbi:uncharacterized protein FA14DRAFT_54003 [Meira miltonrushii]|uniref:Uncharacterized protein n=1 Tax=Meira miltonrushii TaxID=1280837 RepID=A0A316VH00_9BASI|nr:uncharacterized protein FA14DRAFT_54003 [Meira miltonrushii]PWN36308.1 hypothetical protein FA14DRAFT_54003 [Meira miltonrushii]